IDPELCHMVKTTKLLQPAHGRLLVGIVEEVERLHIEQQAQEDNNNQRLQSDAQILLPELCEIRIVVSRNSKALEDQQIVKLRYIVDDQEGAVKRKVRTVDMHAAIIGEVHVDDIAQGAEKQNST